MAEQAPDQRAHFILQNTSQAISFTAKGGGGSPADIPAQNRQQHGTALRAQITALKPVAAQVAEQQQSQGLESGLGLKIQFSGFPNVELAFESLANERQGIELLSIRRDGDATYANVFVPDGKLVHFENYITAYLEEKKDRNGRSRDHSPLINAIASIRQAGLKELWTDDSSLLPEDQTVKFWWEVWLPVRDNRQAAIADFKKVAALSECEVSENQFEFPERTVLLMYASQQQFTQSAMSLNSVAELRRAKDTAEFFDGLNAHEQTAWADELLQRLSVANTDAAAPYICLLDSGINRAHPLLTPLTEAGDLHTVNSAWGSNDTHGHGTGLAGLAAYGDLTEALASTLPIEIPHRLESVKLVNQQGANTGDANHHAYLFKEAVARPEIAAPDRQRVFSSAVTATDYRDRGRPSSWSAAVDSLAADADNEGEFPRLFVQSAGNITELGDWGNYPASLSTNLIHDPGQAWNAITVGAFTNKVDVNGEAVEPVAARGGLSPFTTTSTTWESPWPLKPEIVMEGGNAAKDAWSATTMPSLQLLTTSHDLQARTFTTTNATSAASALCAQMAAKIMAAYPSLRPETVRALIVHSAEWTEAMRTMLPTHPNKTHYGELIRQCGWGVPDIDRAIWSASNSLTLVVEDTIHPYRRDGSEIKTRDMKLHSLPWPTDELESLLNTQVEMRVTLSYFIEPNPSERGSSSKFHYPSFRLKFDVKRQTESEQQFIRRINAHDILAQLGENATDTDSQDSSWLLGNKRHKGSLHQDTWRGTAADLASRGFIGVYPSGGWWKTRKALERYDLPARYSLVVSIKTQQTDVDLYAAVAQKIPVANQVAIET